MDVEGRCVGMKCKTLIFRSLTVALAITSIHCSVNPFDESQVPIIELFLEESSPRIAWTPNSAYRIRIYEGEYDGEDGYSGVIWSATFSDFENGITSPYTIASVPDGVEETGEAVFESGQMYTVTVRRKDPKGSGDGFTNTRNNYIGSQSFVAE